MTLLFQKDDNRYDVPTFDILQRESPLLGAFVGMEKTCSSCGHETTYSISSSTTQSSPLIMKKDIFDKFLLDGLTLFYLSPLRGTDGYGKTDMLMKVGMEHDLAISPFTMVTFDNVYDKMVRDNGYPLPPWHESFRDNEFRDSLVMQFNEIVVDTGVAEMMRMAGYQRREICFQKVDTNGKSVTETTKIYRRLYHKTKKFRDAAKSENVISSEAQVSAVPDETRSVAAQSSDGKKNPKILADANIKQNGTSMKQGTADSPTQATNGSGIMNLADISKALTAVSQTNREEVWKKILTTMSASEKENLKALIE